MNDPLLSQTRSFRADYFHKERELLKKLVQEGQAPNALLVTCSDSRITPAQLFGAQPGDFFVVRNVGNVIPPYIQAEIGTIAALEYAVLRLQVPHLIILGHTDCGGVRSLEEVVSVNQAPALSRWLDFIRPARRDVDFSGLGLAGEERHQAIVEQNVLNQLQNVQSYPFIQKILAANRLELHGWVYDLAGQQIRSFDPRSGVFSSL